MEEEMEIMMMKSVEKARNPSWKLYSNPHYRCLSLSKSRSSYHTQDLAAFARPMDRDGVHLSDLDNALAEIKQLRAELEFERRMRRKVEALNRALARELEEERRRREAAEVTYGSLAGEIARVREEAERAAEEVEDERRMLRMAEAMREERVQMKLSEARFLMEEKIKEMMPTDPSPNKVIKNNQENSSDVLHKKEAENPHIKRGIKGMEFPRAVRVGSSPRSREGRSGGNLGSNLECQRAQLKVLMRHKNPAGAGIIGTAENFVM